MWFTPSCHTYKINVSIYVSIFQDHLQFFCQKALGMKFPGCSFPKYILSATSYTRFKEAIIKSNQITGPISLSKPFLLKIVLIIFNDSVRTGKAKHPPLYAFQTPPPPLTVRAYFMDGPECKYYVHVEYRTYKRKKKIK